MRSNRRRRCPPRRRPEPGAANREQSSPGAAHPALAELRATDADSLTPREALELVYRLKTLAGE